MTMPNTIKSQQKLSNPTVALLETKTLGMLSGNNLYGQFSNSCHLYQVELSNQRDTRSGYSTNHGPNSILNRHLLGFEARSDVAVFLVDAEPLVFLVLAIADVADENGETSHSDSAIAG